MALLALPARRCLALSRMRTLALVLVGLATVALGCPAASSSRPTQVAAQGHVAAGPVSLNPRLSASFESWAEQGPSGDAEHRERLQQLVTKIRARLAEENEVDVLFVCTHNSRRSHMAQLLGLAAAQRSGLTSVRTFSGGTEVTAFNARAIAALERVGFEMTPGEGPNPHVRVRTSPAAPAVEAFSKRYTEAPNPKSGFIVVMTCSQADAACPFVQGAAARVAIPYDDPKLADGTPEETARYDERVAQIGRDLTWVFSRVASRT